MLKPFLLANTLNSVVGICRGMGEDYLVILRRNRVNNRIFLFDKLSLTGVGVEKTLKEVSLNADWIPIFFIVGNKIMALNEVENA